MKAPLAVAITALPPAVLGNLQALLAPFGSRVAFRHLDFDDVIHLGTTGNELEAAVLAVDVGTAGLGDPSLGRLLRSPPAPVVMVSEVDDEAELMTALRLGAGGFLLSDVSGDELVAALRRVAAGQTIVDPTMTARIIRKLAAKETPKPEPAVLNAWNLRPRERQVLESLIEGRNNHQIAEDLNRRTIPSSRPGCATWQISGPTRPNDSLGSERYALCRNRGCVARTTVCTSLYWRRKNQPPPARRPPCLDQLIHVRSHFDPSSRRTDAFAWSSQMVWFASRPHRSAPHGRSGLSAPLVAQRCRPGVPSRPLGRRACQVGPFRE